MRKFLRLFLVLLTYPDKLADAANRAKDSSELDDMISEV